MARRDYLGFAGGVFGRFWRPVKMRLRIRPGRFANFGTGATIVPPAHIHAADTISIGAGTYIGARAVLSMNKESYGNTYAPELIIGERCQFGENLFISGCGLITIGNDVLGSDRVFISDTYHDFADPEVPPVRQPLADPQPVVIGDGVFLGIGCCILPGVTIGERGYVAANAVVTKDVEPWTLVAGNPAKPIKTWNGSAWVSAREGTD